MEAGFKVGDRVRLIPETLSWRAEKTLQGHIAELWSSGRTAVFLSATTTADFFGPMGRFL